MAETAELVSLQTVFEERLKIISEIMVKARENESNVQILRSTLKDMNHVVHEIKEYNEHLSLPREQLRTLVKEKDVEEKEEQFVSKINSLKNLWWDKCLSWMPLYEEEKQTLVAKDIKEALYKLREIFQLISKHNFEQYTLDGIVGKPMMKGPFGVPENCDFTVGLDVPLSKLKMEVLNEDVSTILLTGLGGSGKTTLATKLCWDEQVRGKFNENIIFVTFSKTPKLMIIVERLFEHYGYQVPKFQSDEQAINQLALLLKKMIEASPTLLVLDDVWPGSESLVDEFKFQMSDYKILVTSRVAFPKFGSPFILKPLAHGDAITLFRHCARLVQNSSNIPEEDLVQKVVTNCKGLPLAIKVIGTSLSHQPYELWQKMVEEFSKGHSILDSCNELLTSLQKILDILEDDPIIRECFMDLALFPEDQRIPVPALIDLWTELYGLDDEGIEAMAIINRLDSMNLANVMVARKSTNDADSYCFNSHFIILHDIIRDLAIYQSNQEQIDQRKRMIIERNENNQEWFLREKKKGMMTHILSKISTWCDKQKAQKIPARTLSISTDESCTSYSHIQPTQTEVLIINLLTNHYSFPEILKEMMKLKVLIVTNYGLYPSEMNNFELLGSLFNIKRIRLERISVPPFVTLKNLKKLSLYLCNTRKAFENSNILISDAFPNLEDLSIDYCKEMMGLPKGLCDITPLKKLSITNCHKLCALPQEIGKLENLELLRLSYCTDLEGLPDSIGKLSNLRHADISNCIKISYLPEEFGNLCNLRNLFMTSCGRCELPYSMVNLKNLKVVTCDEETAASWEAFKPMLPNLKIDVPRFYVNLNWLHATHSE